MGGERYLFEHVCVSVCERHTCVREFESEHPRKKVSQRVRKSVRVRLGGKGERIIMYSNTHTCVCVRERISKRAPNWESQ